MPRKWEKILTAKFDFTDFPARLLKNMGSLGGIIKLIPGMNKLSDDQLKQGETQLKRSEAMINSMTVEERRNPICWQVRPVGGSPVALAIRRRMR